MPNLYYPQRCTAAASALHRDGWHATDVGYNDALCQHLRVEHSTELREVPLLSGRVKTVEFWRGTQKRVPEWFNA
jgi:hypothetical protein